MTILSRLDAPLTLSRMSASSLLPLPSTLWIAEKLTKMENLTLSENLSETTLDVSQVNLLVKTTGTPVCVIRVLVKESRSSLSRLVLNQLPVPNQESR